MSSKRKKIVITIIVLVVIIGVAGWLLVSHRSKKSSDTTAATTATKPQSSERTGTQYSMNPDVSTPNPDPNVPGGTTTASPTLELSAPSGTFVSNHKPNLDGNPAPSQEVSTCITTSGASCTITFTKDGTSKSLPAQTADKDGATSWNWNVKDLGLTEGTWQITAKATLGSQTKSTTDQLSLEVGP